MKNCCLKLHNLTKINFTQEGHPASSSHRRVAWHPDGQDHYSNLLSMRLLTVQSPVLPGSWCWSFWISNRCRSTDLPRRGSFVVLALPSMRLIQAEPEDYCIHQMNGSDFGWKGGWKNEKNLGIAEKSVLSCTKKHHNKGLFSVETDNFVNGNAFV